MAEKIIKVRRANVVLRIKESEAERYLDKGYNILNEDGTVKESAIPSTMGELKVAYTEHKAEIAKLKKEIAKLKKQLKSEKSE